MPVDIRIALMQRIIGEKGLMENASDDVRLSIQAKFEKERDESRNCNRLLSGNRVFEVTHKFDNLHVDMNVAHCSYRKWNLTGISCYHAIAYSTCLKQNAEDSLPPFFKREKCM